MAEDRALPRRQQGGKKMPFLGEQFGPYSRVHARMDAVQPARAQRTPDRRSDTPAASNCARATIPLCSAAIA